MVVKLSLTCRSVGKGADVLHSWAQGRIRRRRVFSQEMKRTSRFEVSLWFSKICS